ncbi:hypothetical protein [Streptomyces sp. NBC_00829]|uniref:hypothetical protein n=1 Tax=Streptomyces sp. NBC_00829 TaxID=2903679 RepID=UPI002F91208B|nr:hypothetical protein OG293_40520 [Streptomyces sp. NBC_00829]
MRGEHEQDRPVRWRVAHPEAYAEMKRTWGVIGHSSVLMVLSLSLIGTSLTIGYLHMAGWLQSAVRLGTSLAAVCCGSVALWRLIPALWRALRAVIRTRRRRWDSESTWTTSVEETGRTAGSDAYGAGGPTTPDASAEQPAPPHPPLSR